MRYQNCVIRDLEGREIKAHGGKDAPNATLASCIVEALRSAADSDKISGAEKFDRYALAVKVKKSEEFVELTIDEAAKVKEIAGRLFPVEIVGAIYTELEHPIPDTARGE